MAKTPKAVMYKGRKYVQAGSGDLVGLKIKQEGYALLRLLADHGFTYSSKELQAVFSKINTDPQTLKRVKTMMRAADALEDKIDKIVTDMNDIFMEAVGK